MHSSVASTSLGSFPFPVDKAEAGMKEGKRGGGRGGRECDKRINEQFDRFACCVCLHIHFILDLWSKDPSKVVRKVPKYADVRLSWALQRGNISDPSLIVMCVLSATEAWRLSKGKRKRRLCLMNYLVFLTCKIDGDRRTCRCCGYVVYRLWYTKVTVWALAGTPNLADDFAKAGEGFLYT